MSGARKAPSQSGAAAGSKPAPISLVRSNFVTDDFERGPDDRYLFYFFTRADVTNRTDNSMSFGNMKPEQKLLLRILFYASYCVDGAVYLLNLEPGLAVASECSWRLSPALRCCVSGDYCLFVKYRASENPYDRMADSLGFPAGDAPACETHRRVADAIKRLVCLDMNLTTSVDLYIQRTDPERSDALLALFDWERWSYAMDLGGRGAKIRTCVNKPLDEENPCFISRNALTCALMRYFDGDPLLEEDAHGGFSSGDLFWFAAACLSDPRNHPVYASYASRSPESKCAEFVASLSSPGSAGRPGVSAREVLLFRYDTEHLLNKDNFNLFEAQPIIHYPFRGGASARADASLSSYVHDVVSGASPMLAKEDARSGAAFKINWPHLRGLVEVCEDLDGSPDAPRDMSEYDRLVLKCEVFSNLVLNSSERIVHEPSRGIFRRARQLLRRGVGAFGGVRMSWTGAGRDHTLAPKMADHYFLHKVFVDTLGVGRNVQAFATMLHVLHSTAPRWKLNKTMIINHTRGGTGKSHTNNLIKQLFARVPGLFGGMSTFTDTVFKYSESEVSKVMLMDDVGFSSGQHKNLAHEDSSVAAQFKSLLDLGYTNNIATGKDVATSTFKVNVHLMVYNVAFVWNTNTMGSFTKAWMDRCFVLGPELLTAPLALKNESEVTEGLAGLRIPERFENMFLRHHLFQTLMFTLLKDGGPSPGAFAFATKLSAYLAKTFPAVNNRTTSKIRENFILVDMAMAACLRTAINTAFEWWVPPWTRAPDPVAGESIRSYLPRLDLARARALHLVGLPEMTIEALAQSKLFMPASVVEVGAVIFNQSAENIFKVLFLFLERVLASDAEDSMERSANRTVTFNNPGKLAPRLFRAEQQVFEDAKQLSVERDGKLVHVVEELTQNALVMDGRAILEILKLHMLAEFQRLERLFANLFREAWAETGALEDISYSCPTAAEANLLTLLSIVRDDELDFTHGTHFLVHPTLFGISTELARTAVPRERWRDMGRLPAKYHVRAGTSERLSGALSDVPDPLVTAEYAPHAPDFNWLRESFITRELLSGQHFQHSNCGVFPHGDALDLCGGGRRDVRSDAPHESWEYRDAFKVYERYVARRYSEGEMYAILTRYLTYSSDSIDRPVEGDRYLSALSAALPKTSREAAEAVRAHYGTPLRTITERIRALKRAPPEQRDSPPEPMYKRFRCGEDEGRGLEYELIALNSSQGD